MGRLFRMSFLLALLAGAIAFAESDSDRQAREDLERQLKAMVGTPPTKIRVEFVGLDQPNYDLLEASFELDGSLLPVGDLKKLNAEGEHLIFNGDVTPGKHRLVSRLHFQNRASQVISQEGGFKWKPGSEVEFKAESGIEVTLKVTPELDLKADLKNRIKVKSPATVKMLAKLDDGSMPPPAPRPNIVLPTETPDAGAAVAAADAKKKAREDALEAKKAAAEEKKRKADEAKAARLAAAEDRKAATEAKKQAAADAAASKKQAAADAAASKKQAAADAAAAKKQAAADAAAKKVADAEGAKQKPPPVDHPAVAVADPPPAVVDAGAPAEVDAGTVAVAVAPPTASEKATPAAAAESGLPLPVWIGIGAAGLGLLLFFLSRLRNRKLPTDF